MPNPALKALSHRNYRLFFFGQSISLIGTWMTRLATSWLAFASQMPTFLFAPIGGIWADRLDRRRVLILT
jgi:MFS family permease